MTTPGTVASCPLPQWGRLMKPSPMSSCDGATPASALSRRCARTGGGIRVAPAQGLACGPRH
eukprot:616906-Pelagomonas_calceolata.AAC.1